MSCTCLFRTLTCGCFNSSVSSGSYSGHLANGVTEEEPASPGTTLQSKWLGFLRTMRVARRRREIDVNSSRYAFALILRLYAHKQVMDELEQLFNVDPNRFCFYVPQFVSFALFHSNMSSSSSLSSSPSSLNVYYDDDERHIDTHVGSRPKRKGELNEFLQEKAEGSLTLAQRIYWFVRSFAPKEMKTELVVQVERRAEKACRRLVSNPEKSAQGIHKGKSQEDHDQEEKFELIKPLPRFAAGPPHVLGTSEFQWAISFFDELTHMGVTLKEEEENKRNRVLRASLDALCKDYLPSSVLYLPVGGKPAQIVNIVVSESFCFKTNTRVPFMVCFEVLQDVEEDLHNNVESESIPNSPTSTDQLKEKIKGTFGEWKTQLQRQFSSTMSKESLTEQQSNRTRTLRPFSSVNEGDVEMIEPGLRRRASSGDFSPMGIQTSSDQLTHGRRRQSLNQDPLGQWTPKLRTLGRGAGFSHFAYHQDFDFESVRTEARKKALAQHHSTGAFTDIDLGGSESDFTEKEALERYVSYGSKSSLDASEEDDNSSLEDLHDIDIGMAHNPGGLVSPSSFSQEEEEDEVERQEADDREKGVIFRERWTEKERRVAAQSRWSHDPRWRLIPVIVKSGDDLRQEQFAAQLIKLFQKIFKEEGLKLWVDGYDVMATCPDSGLIQAVPDTISLDSLKKNDPYYMNLRDFFIRFFGKPKSPAFLRAQENFCQSLAAYCIISYILQIKDRHNGNILLTADGHLVHIDWGYLLSSQGPGNMNFERYPFKLTTEFVQVLGGPDSACFRRFRSLCCQAFLAARKRREQFVLMIEMMLHGEGAEMACFQAGGQETIRQLNERFCIGKSRAACISYVNDLIDTSIGHWRSRWYDLYQRFAVGIAV